jgi:hypothetical protein
VFRRSGVQAFRKREKVSDGSAEPRPRGSGAPCVALRSLSEKMLPQTLSEDVARQILVGHDGSEAVADVGGVHHHVWRGDIRGLK